VDADATLELYRGKCAHATVQPSEWEQFFLAETPDVYHGSPDPGDLYCKSRDSNRAICSHYEGWWSQYAIAALAALELLLTDMSAIKHGTGVPRS